MLADAVKIFATKLRSYTRGIGLYGIYLAQGIDNDTFRAVGGKFGASGLPSKTKFGEFVPLVVEILLAVAGSVAVIFLILGAYRYIVARGNEEQMESAKKTMTGAIIGLVIIALAFAIIAIIANILIGKTGLPE